jgi:hypothetical protein
MGEKNKNSPGERVLGLGFQKISKGHLLNGGTGGCWVTQAIALEPLGIKKPSHNFTSYSKD